MHKVGPPVFRLHNETNTLSKIALPDELWTFFLSYLSNADLLQFASTSKPHYHYLCNISPIWTTIRDRRFPPNKQLPPFTEYAPYPRYLKTLEYFDTEIPALHKKGKFYVTQFVSASQNINCCTMGGNLLCTGSDEGLVNFYRMVEGEPKLLSSRMHYFKIIEIKSSDGFFGTLCEERTLNIWDLRSLHRFKPWPSIQEFEMEDSSLFYVEKKSNTINSRDLTQETNDQKQLPFEITHFTKTTTHFYVSNEENQLWEMDRKTGELKPLPLKIEGRIYKLAIDKNFLQVYFCTRGDGDNITLWDLTEQKVVDQYTFQGLTKDFQCQHGLIYRLNERGMLTISKKENPEETMTLHKNDFNTFRFQSFELHEHKILTCSDRGVELWNFRFSCPSSTPEKELQLEWEKLKSSRSNAEEISKKEVLICIEMLLHALYQGNLEGIKELLKYIGPIHEQNIHSAYVEAMETDMSTLPELPDDWEESEWNEKIDDLHLSTKIEALKKYRDALLNNRV